VHSSGQAKTEDAVARPDQKDFCKDLDHSSRMFCRLFLRPWRLPTA
jgi:hypothetical protein